MASIPDDKIAEVRGRADIVQVIGRVVNLRKAGRSYQGLCPFHDEKTPSFNVTPERQMYYCFGCQAGGDVFRFLMDYEGRTFPEAVRRLAEEVGVELPTDDRPEDPRVRQERNLRKAVLAANARAADAFVRWLGDDRAGEAGRSHLADRGIEAAVARDFGLGYAPLRNDLHRRLVDAGVESQVLYEAGLSGRNERGAYERFRGRLMVPIRSADGAVVGFGARVVEGDHPAKYLNSPESVAYKKSEVLFGLDLAREHIRRQDAVVVVEGYFDVIALHQAGVKNAVATCGTSLTPGHCRLLARHARDVFLVFDGDEAGLKAAARAYESLSTARNLVGRVVLLPRGEDPDTFVRAQGADAFRALCNRAKPVIEFLLDHALRDVGLSVEERVRGAEKVAPILRMVGDAVERRQYAELVADRLNIKLDTLRAYLKGAAADGRGPGPRGPGGHGPGASGSHGPRSGGPNGYGGDGRFGPEEPPPPGFESHPGPPAGPNGGYDDGRTAGPNGAPRSGRPAGPPPPGAEEAIALLALSWPEVLDGVGDHLDDFTHAGIRDLLSHLCAERKALGQVNVASALERVEDPMLAGRWRAHWARTDSQEDQPLDAAEAAKWAGEHLRRVRLAALDQKEAAMRRRLAADGADQLTVARQLQELKNERRRLSRPSASNA